MIPKIRDIHPVLAATHASEADLSARRYEYLVARRDTLLDRLRFGSLALNGASLVALLSLLGGDGHAAMWVGFNPHRALISAVAFALGVSAAGAAAEIDANAFKKEAADAFSRQLSSARLAARYEGEATEKSLDDLKTDMGEHHALPLVDFQFSKLGIYLRSASGGLWLFGVAVPFCAALGWR